MSNNIYLASISRYEILDGLCEVAGTIYPFLLEVRKLWILNRVRFFVIVTILMAFKLQTMAQSVFFENAHEAVRHMGIGWNLGNTLESCSHGQDSLIERTTDCSVKAYETAWGQPQATRELMHKMKEAGFMTIRVPVTWYPHMDKDDHVDEAWMQRVEEVVNYVLDEGLYCVLNVHHDAGDKNTCWLRADMDRIDEISTRFVMLWQQIATRFNKYGERLIFEGWGEIIDKYGAWNFPKDSLAFDACNHLAQSFVNTVRATGGNNAQRNLMLCTYSASPGGWYAHDGNFGYSDDALAKFQFPEDTAIDHLIASVHSYIPWNWDQGHAKLTEKHIGEIKQTFKNIDEHLLARNMPLVIGEYGALFCDGVYSQEGDITEGDKDEGANYARLMVEEAVKRDIALLYFMGLIDKEDRVRLQWSRPKTVEAIVNTYHKMKD